MKAPGSAGGWLLIIHRILCLQLKMDYRKEIDGLRALAVGSVILNHVSEKILPSGYLGVDIFFVISGYVITASLYNRKNIKLSELILDFYARRIKRLFPALVVFVVLSSILISLFDPSPQTQLKTGLTSLFGLSNLYLIRQATDYFGDSAQLNIFTHTWSLGVEEQFYVIFPIIIWLTSFRINSGSGNRSFLITIGALALLSLSAFIYLNHAKPSFSYFSMPTRFWELAAGSYSYWLTHLCRYTKVSKKYSASSLILTIAALGIMFFPEKYHTGTTISITLITVSLIYFIQPKTIAYIIFSSRPVVQVGLISYSLYLWHWGILTLSKWTIGVYWWSLPFQVLLMFFLAAISYHYIEQPLRKINWSGSRLITIGYGATTAVFASVLIIFLKNLSGTLYTGKQLELLAVGVSSLTNEYSLAERFYWKGADCVLSDNNQVGKFIPIKGCTLGDYEKAKTRVLVIGNSFSAAFSQAFDKLVLDDNYAIMITSAWGASPVKGLENNGPWSKANDYYWDHVIPSLIAELKPGDWVFMINDMAGFSPENPSEKNNISLSILAAELEIFSDELAKQNLHLAVLHGNPFAREANCEPAKAIKQWFAPYKGQCKFISKNETIMRRENLDKILRGLESINKLKVIDLIDIFCPRSVCDYESEDNQILYRDVYSHPSVEGARLSAPIIRSVLNN